MNRLVISLLAGVAALSVISSADAADLIIAEPVAGPGYVDLGGNWDGAYIGAFAGYGWGTATEEGPLSLLADDPLEVSGWLLGVSAGADFTIAEGLVAGIVGDIAWSNITGERSIGEGLSLSYDVNWVGSLRGRLGFDGGSFLPYVTGGLAFANATAAAFNGFDTEDTQTHVGWTAGAGVEFAVADDVSLDLQYRYTDYGSKDYTDGATDAFSLTSHVVTGGVNFRF